MLHITGHSKRVNAVSFTNDGNSLLTASSDNTIKVWDAKVRDYHPNR